MKRNKKQGGKRSKVLLLSVVALLMCVVAQAQNSVADYTGITGKDLTTIVREYSEEKFVLYAAGKTKSFCLVEMSGAAIFDAPLPTRFTVNDFEILDGKVYFCGFENAYPIVGWFDVDSLFGSLSPIWYTAIPSTLNCPDFAGQLDTITKLTRITPVNFFGNVQLLLTGEATCSMTTTLNHCLVDVYYDGTGWMMAYHQEYMGIYYYDDIEVTTSEIVIVGHKEGTSGEYVQSYSLPAGPYQDIFYAQALGSMFSKNTDSYNGSEYIPDMHKDILVEGIVGNKFATATYGAHFVYPNLIQGTFLNIYNSVGNLASRWFIQEHCGGNRELRYNYLTNSIMLLFDSCSSTWRDGYIEFYLDNTHTNVTNVEFHKETSKGSYSSLDACPNSAVNGKTVLTGRSPAYNLRIWQHINKPDTECSKDIPLDVVQIPLDVNTHPQDVCFLYKPLSIKRISLNAEEKELDVKCKATD